MSTRGRILDAAASVLRTKGLARATTKEIAKAAELSEAALYKHFAGKTELFLAVLGERVPGELLARLTALPERVGAGAVRGTLVELTRAMLVFFGESFPMAASLFAEPELFAAHRAVLRERGNGPQFVGQAVAGYLAAEQAGGRLADGVDPVGAAELLTGACMQHAFLGHFVEPAESLDQVAERLVGTLLAGLGK
ncbi:MULTISPECIES: TetR/AcrR family transcriptional regulator [unclassified Crossiella]|uniref:TetR/AcrR family transcriptional regulator n=1 Tax=unclassified Crossiella TaxID=2620835 RepID=UPI001FFF5FF6|nr:MULTISPECIES: TetR/AcrR family transcriptional regulator [unclassified Crossiella]MCK2237378.1 TetR/AcrR family transcriptional regulator [Crossiella sp. S99.2]MCK2251033.1 TetR/AcrR family transcriptional regulator [Crossiella sp. S99.1]